VERSRTGHAAGLRTTLLVTLAASVAMIQTNLLIATNGKPQNSYVVMDLMRLPLGILTGVGFIGAGAIVRKSAFVMGLTTAATLWFATVVGLCMGGGQLILGSVSTAIGFAVLWWLRIFEARIEHYQVAELTVVIVDGQLSAQMLRDHLRTARFQIKSLSMAHSISKHLRKFDCAVRWPAAPEDAAVPADLLQELERLPGLISLEWKTNGIGSQ